MERRLPAALRQPRAIERFAGENRFLSNFFLKPLTWNGERWPSAEHAYQAAKCSRPEQFRMFRNAPTPGAAKRLGRKVEMRGDWDRVKEKVMLSVVRAKFADPYLRRRLLATGEAELVEGNEWGDRFWGVCRGAGENRLGKILMRVRTEIRS
ncbi:MAG: NADAR family protein [Bryobacterales bacterium]|nr:NADAR family protein [Bryobacterales bacterium]